MKPETRLSPDTDIRKYLLSLSPNRRALAIDLLGEEDLVSLDRSWPTWRHGGQTMPDGAWRTWVMMAARGYGKTRAGAEWVRHLVDTGKSLQIAVVSATLEEARKVLVEGRSGLLEVADLWIEDWLPSRGLLKFAGGSEARLFSGASPEILRGPEHHYAWCDELAKWEKPGETWDMLQLGLRLGTHPRAMVTTTPKQGAALTRIIAANGCVRTGGKTRENPHLPNAFVAAVEELYAGTRFGRQELEGELLPDAAGALWSVELLERCRIPPRNGEGDHPQDGGGARADMAHHSDCTPPPRFARSPSPCRGGFTRTVIGVDPPSGDGTCGIIACAIDADGIGYVLADHSVTARSPEGWARAVAAAAEVHGASLVVAETNQGGKMVEATLKAADAKLRVKAVQASISKSDRATPVSAAFEGGKVFLCGRFEQLEAELCGLIAGGGYEGPGRSPDRADAMVWALSELMLGKEPVMPRITVL